MAHSDASASPLSPSIAPVASSQQDKFVHGKKEEQRKEKQVQSTQSTVSSQTIKKVKKATVQLDVTKILHTVTDKQSLKWFFSRFPVPH